MFIRKPQLLSIISLFVLVACQNMGSTEVTECLAGFVKTKTGCRSVKSLSSEELSEADSRLNSQIATGEAELAARIETKKMIDKMKEAEAANRRAQIAETTAATATNYARSQAPVGFLGERTAAPIPRVTEKAALRSELKESFANEFRGKTQRGGSIMDGAQ